MKKLCFMLYALCFMLNLTSCKKEIIKQQILNEGGGGTKLKSLIKSDNPTNIFKSNEEKIILLFDTIPQYILTTNPSQEKLNSILEYELGKYSYNITESDIQLIISFFEKENFNLKGLYNFEKEILLRFGTYNHELLKFISFHKGLCSSFRNNINEVDLDKANGGPGQAISRFESCFERCVEKKLSEVFNNGNWIDKTAFILNATLNTSWYVASCGWNCR